MTTVIPCPECGKKLNLPEEALGKKGQCPSCGYVFVAGRLPGDDEDDDGPPTYEPTPKPEKKRKVRYDYNCEVCDAPMREDAFFCELCGTRVPEEDEPDTPETRARRKRKRKQKAEDEYFQGLDRVVMQVGFVVAMVILFFCAYLPFALVVGVIGCFVFGGLLIRTMQKRTETEAEERLKKIEQTRTLIQLIIMVAITALVAGIILYIAVKI